MRFRLQLATAVAVFAAVLAAVLTAVLAATGAQAGTTGAVSPVPAGTISDIVSPSMSSSPPPLNTSPLPPFPPGNLTVVTAASHFVTLSWTASRSGCCSVGGYIVRYSEGSSDTVWTQDVGNVTTATITANIQPAMTYHFSVVAYDWIGGHVSAPSNSVTVPTPSDLSTPSTPVVSPVSCRVTYADQAQWAGGFVATITIANDGSTAFNDWVLGFTFGGDQKVVNAWGGTATQSGAQVTVRSVPWNATIPPHASVSVGMQGTWAASNAPPRAFTVNAGACTVA